MTEGEFSRHFTELGWRTARDSIRDLTLTYDLADRHVSFIMNVKKTRNKEHFSAKPSVTTTRFEEYFAKLHDSIDTYAPIKTEMKGYIIEAQSLNFHHAETISADFIKWASTADLALELSKLANLPTDSKGAFALRHLAALVATKNVEKLEYYASCFDNGERLGFIPFITKDKIMTALHLARK